MKSINPKLMVVVLALALSSCKNLYVQKNVFVPLLKEKGELKVDGSLGREAVSVNTAYALHDNFSCMLNAFSTLDNSDQYKRNYSYQLEAALGFQKVFRDSLHFESYLGASRGWFDTDFDRATGELKHFDIFWPHYLFGSYIFLIFLSQEYERVNARGSYQTFFFQNSISIFSKLSSTTFTARAQYIQFNEYKEEGEYNGQKIWYGITIPPKIFLQPVLTNKIRIYNTINGVGQFGYNIPLFEGPSHRDVFQWNNMFYSIGIEIGLDTKRWKKY